MGLFNFLFKKDKNKLVNTVKVEENVIRPKEVQINKKKEKITFKVEGISDIVIQREIKSMVKEEKDINDLYEGLSNEKILEKYLDEDKIYEVRMSGDHEIQLIKEPENKYDPTAIKVVHEEIGHVGYVPAADCKKVKKAIEDGYSVEWRLTGGKYKVIENDSEKNMKVVKINNNTFGMTIVLTVT